MKNKTFLISLLIALLIGGIIVFFVAKGTSDSEEAEENNTELKIITISFNSKGGNDIDDIQVTVGSSVTLPVPEREGYTFTGWYNGDVEYTVETTSNIKDNIVLTAKWEKKIETEPTPTSKSIKISFDSREGSKVNSITVKCTDNVATIPTLPKPTKDAYNFLSWEDKFGKSILEGAKLTCEGDLTLYAIWEYDGPVANTDPTLQKTYKCPSGFELKDGTRCVKLAEPTKYCKDGWKEVDGKCVNPSSPNPKGERTCPSKTYSGWTGTGTYYEAGRGYCGYYELTSYIGQSQNCKNAGGTLATNNHCYKYIEIDYKTTCAKDEEYFKAQVIAPGNGGGCYQVTSMSKKCPDGYTNASVWGECALVQDAIYE